MAFNGTPSGATYDTSGQKFGSGALASNFIDLPAGSAGSGSTWTIECWIKAGSNPGNVAVAVGSGDASPNGWGYIGLSTAGKPWFNVNTNNVTVAGSNAITDGAWHHLAFVGTASGITGFVDGVSVGTNAQVQSIAGACISHIGCLQSSHNYGFGAGEIDEVAFFNTARYSANFTPPTSPYTGNEAGLVSLYHLDGNANDSAVTSKSIAPNDAAILYSPFTWLVGAASAKTINAGASFRTLFTGSSLALNFDISNASAPLPQIYYRIDGYEAGAPWTKAAVATTINVSMPADTSSAAYHLLEVIVKSTSETVNRWNSPQNTGIVFTGLTIGAAAAVLAPASLAKRLLVYGDSITEGVRTVNQTAANDTDRNDAMQGWAHRLGALLGADVGVVGFGATGLTVAGSGNVPALPSAYNLLWAGQARDFSTLPSLIVLNEGTNDSGASAASVTSATTSALNGLLAACPNVPIAVLRPFNGAQATAIQAGIAACSNPGLVSYIDTTGFFNTAYGADSLNLHPTGANNLGLIAPQVAEKLRPLLYPAGSRPTFRMGFAA